MDQDSRSRAEAAAQRVIELEEELEASGYAALDEDSIAQARAALHKWIDTVTGLVISPALGKVTLIHAKGRESVIASSDLAFAMSAPVHRD
jgi:hypothetical protein